MSTTLVSGHAPALHLEVIRIPPQRPFQWIAQGWRDLRRHWATSLGYGALIAALGWSVLVLCGTHPYLIAAAISGFLLVGPPMSAGLCEMSRRYSLGEPASFDESLDGFARNFTALFEFGVILAICAVIWFALSAVLLDKVFHVALPTLGATMYQGFLASTNRTQVLAYIVIGGLLAVGVFAVSVVAIPLMIDRHASVGQAMRASVGVAAANVPAMLIWSGLILVLTIAGYATFLAGLVLIVPLLGHATWHAYKGTIR
ncbi:MAG: DUF2189 domain-containing protein [Gammaproteobacteria bacterium]|nr:DUF2189 domain-containing protein [Gammaproteobacteria bacterium]MDE2347941.1 DUF2189 domain-containing protein [Gammaproteobacteria bacterium]